ncbi:TetR/AcrR family transcriptional regulator [Aquimarina litoralis]|uniref:TetR/AcrR family transcriptional regulator n=1 Tax=Aquimarina litoralis TaxID=584605 RepID=UPI001C585AD8|nr:TetR/AcrR family transcriptional regulator [Aquimarina litoralis]MBW1295399.1 TetR family transcriptional regulator [Aquimarina litoralis]
MLTKTKDRIIQAAIDVFNHDFSAPLQKVADNANVTRRTLHRYFKDRDELVATCEREMEVSCKKAMIAAIKSSDDSLMQLENMLNAGIDCGAKYYFFYKLYQQEGHKRSGSNKDCEDYDYIYSNFKKIIKDLQNKGIVDKKMTIEWIQNLHAGIINSTVNAKEIDQSNGIEIRKFAWKSFINGIST